MSEFLSGKISRQAIAEQVSSMHNHIVTSTIPTDTPNTAYMLGVQLGKRDAFEAVLELIRTLPEEGWNTEQRKAWHQQR